MKRNTAIILIVVVVLALIGVIALAMRAPATDTNVMTTEEMDHSTMDGMNSTTTSSTGTSQGPSATGGVTIKSTGTEVKTSTGTVKEFKVASQNFSFSISEMVVKKGDRVRIVLSNIGGVHDWKIDEFKAGTKTLQGAGTDTIEFVADKAGSFEYYCSVGNHRAMGMKGTLVVQE